MTHIEPGVRADSMRLLDTMLTTLPTLTAAHTPTLLPHFLDLISQRPGDTSGQIRTLSLHLDGSVTSEKWRGQVIGQLNRLFSVVWESSKKGSNALIFLSTFLFILIGKSNANHPMYGSFSFFGLDFIS